MIFHEYVVEKNIYRSTHRTHTWLVFKSPSRSKTNIILTDVEMRYVHQTYITTCDTFMVAEPNDVGTCHTQEIYMINISL